ncbi:hypothetical protein HOD08_04170 [bacterium]|nr:hypothetical protein [bacterium]
MNTLKIIALTAAVAIAASPMAYANEALRTSAKRALEAIRTSNIEKCWNKLYHYMFEDGDFAKGNSQGDPDTLKKEIELWTTILGGDRNFALSCLTKGNSDAYDKRISAPLLAMDMTAAIDRKCQPRQPKQPSEIQKDKDSLESFFRYFRETKYTWWNPPTSEQIQNCMNEAMCNITSFLEITLAYNFPDNVNDDETSTLLNGISEIIEAYENGECSKNKKRKMEHHCPRQKTKKAREESIVSN